MDRRVFPWFPLVVFVVGLGCMVVLGFLAYQNLPTEGLYKLVIEGDYSEEELCTKFPMLQKEELIGPSREWVYINAMGNIEAVSLEQYYQRISPEDPRYDRYVEQVWSLFAVPSTGSTDSYRVFYLRTDKIEGLKRALLKEQKQFHIVRLGGSSLPHWLLWIASFIGFGSSLWFIITFRLPYLFFSVFPVFIFLSKLGTEGLVGSMALLSLLALVYLPLEELVLQRTSWRKISQWFQTELRQALYAVLLYGGVMVFSFSHWYWFFLALLGSWFVLTSLFMVRFYIKKHSRPFFSPVPILSGNRKVSQWKKALILYGIGIPLVLVGELVLTPQANFEELGEDLRQLKEHYQAYIEKQATFMYTSLADPDREYQMVNKNRDGFLETDGVLIPDISKWQHLELPPLESFFFPVSRTRGEDRSSSFKLPVLLLSLFWYSVIIQGGTRWVVKKRKKIALYEKRIAA
ncbi:MAG: hypothetical protein N2Z76_04820 [Treponemataceae bacterium]|nr:hypothetical protein [Treponemataceae bacterium]